MRGRQDASRALALMLAVAGPVGAQAPDLSAALSQGVVQFPFATLDENRLFTGSRYGQALLAVLEGEQARLAAENRDIESTLAGRERDLTERRGTLAPEAFRALADAFNDEVETVRAEQNAKERAIYQRHDAERLRFRDAANQVLAQIMAERGALAIIAEEAIVLGFRDIDITQEAIDRLDSLLGDGPPAQAVPPTP